MICLALVLLVAPLCLVVPASAAASSCANITPDPPLPASAWRRGGEWLVDGNPSLQGWDIYQKMLVDGATGPGADRWIEELVTERLPGLGTLIMQPPRTGFRYGGGGGAGGSNASAFAAAIAAFRRRGLRVVLYSSVVHLGEDAEWASGNLSRQHPEWSQRLRDQAPATLETKPMLSAASAAAVAYNLNYTLDLLHRFPADGVYLDDNQLGCNASDPADYSAAAVGGWREYLTARFGQAWSAQCLGYADISSAPIPAPPAENRSVVEQAQWGAWLRYRQRVMALSNEVFRSALHRRTGDDG
eukprot:SAG11_NODE_333_length_10574_cov_7.889451_7_plen_301_part_00